MTVDELRELADRATFLPERLAAGWIADDTPAVRSAAQARLERWCHLAAGGDGADFTRRLAWDGLDCDRALLLLTDGHPAQPNPLPAWADFLAAALTPSRKLSASWKVEPHPVPLVQLVAEAAQIRLAAVAAAQLPWLSPPAQASLHHHLTQRLISLAQPTLDHAFPVTDPWTLYHSFPVLARQLCTVALHWADEIHEFLNRLAADWPDRLGPGCVADVRPGLSDPHRGGRTVWRVQLADGPTLAYKPKDLTQDRAWNDLLAWCNGRGLQPALHTLDVIPRSGYGWMAWAEPDDAPATPIFYRRAGVFLGLLHLLHAADVHVENVVRHGQHPLLVDAEMMPYPQVAGHAQADPLDVLRPGLLPRWLVDRTGTAEIGGLSGPDASAQRGEVVAGFQSFCRFADTHWADLNAADGPLAAFRRGIVRFAPRPTAAYLRLADHLRHPAFLGRGSDFSVEMDRLSRTFLADPAKTRFRPLLAAEHAALAQGDVPLFTAHIGQPDLSGGTEPIKDALVWPPIAPPDPDATLRDTRLIRASLDRSPYLTPLSPGSFLAHALRLGELLAQRAVPLAGDTVGWIGVQFQPRSGLHQHGLIGDDLYAGRAGIALFLAALYRTTGDADWKRLALSALQPVDAEDSLDLGGRLYALGHAAHLLNDSLPAQWGAAVAVQRSSTFEKSRTSEAWGILDGRAGLILGLLNLPGSSKLPGRLDYAATIGDDLLAHQSAWLDPDTALGGFSHGAAGIAHGLTRLYAATGEERFLAGARQAWDFQHTLFDMNAGNWQDRRGAQPVFLTNWCNGAAGIGLAAASDAPLLPELTETAERAGDLLMAAEIPFLDTLCCGGFGQIDCLLEMGRLLDRPAWVRSAQDQARQILAHADSAGAFQLYDDLPAHLFNPAFFRGVAGIGYSLLRLAGVNGEVVQTVPCVLNWGD